MRSVEDLIERLDNYTKEYLELESQKEIYYKEHLDDMSRCTIVTLYLMQANIDTVIKQICSVYSRCVRKGINVENECAHLVYSYYMPRIRRGLSDLL